MVDAARGKGSASGGQERPGNDSGNGVAARTMDQPLNRAGGPLGLVKRKLKKVCDSYGLSVMKSLRLETFELICSPVIGCAYLLITNMPTDGEIQAARTSLGND